MKALSWISCIALSTNLFLILPLFANEICEKPLSSLQKEYDSIVYGGIDYLLWFSNQDGLQSPTVATGASPNLSSNWSSGVRVSIGGQPAHWDTELCYTYYSTSSNDKSNANIATILTSTPSTAGIFEVSEKWNLNFNRLDLHLGRKILFGPHFLLEPFFGLEGLCVSQKFDLNTNTIFLDLVTHLPATNKVDSQNKTSLLGIGPQFGFKAHYNFKAGFGFYGNFEINTLWGKFQIKQDYSQKDYYSSGNPTVLVDQIKELSQGGAIFNTDLEIGLTWKHLFQKQNLELTLKFGWEQHYYIDIIRFQDFYLQQTSLGTASYITNGNLALSGLTLGILLRY